MLITEDTLDSALIDEEMAENLLYKLKSQNIARLSCEIAEDWDLPANMVQEGFETILSHLELVQGDTSLLYEMI